MIAALPSPLRRLWARIKGVAEEARGCPQSSPPDASAPATWVPPGHYYSPIVDPVELTRRRAWVFDRTREPADIELEEEAQRDLVAVLEPLYRRLPFNPEKSEGLRYCYENPAFSYADGIVLACMMLHLGPRRVIEVGCGYSSCVILDVNEIFFEHKIDCTFVDPYPDLLYSLMKPGDRERCRVLPVAVQDLDLKVADELKAHDILFIDSTHVAKAGGDVNHNLFVVLPRIAPGVFIHFHDVFYPFEYPESWFFEENRSWNELYLLRAFLAHNPAYRIVFFNDFMYRHHQSLLDRRMPLFGRNPGGSLWLEKLESGGGPPEAP